MSDIGKNSFIPVPFSNITSQGMAENVNCVNPPALWWFNPSAGVARCAIPKRNIVFQQESYQNDPHTVDANPPKCFEHNKSKPFRSKDYLKSSYIV